MTAASNEGSDRAGRVDRTDRAERDELATARDVVLVTGGSGFIGRALVGRLLAAGHAAVVLDRPGGPPPPDGAAAVDVDLTSDDSVRDALRQVRERHGERIASVVHLAAYFDLSGEPNEAYERVTLRGTERLLRELRASMRLEQFVFVSTMLVHAPGGRGRRIDESWPLDPKLPYRASKIETERLIREQRGDVPAVFVRPAGVYDDGGHAAFLAHQIARLYERSVNARVYPGDLDSGQPYLHLDDLVDALARIVERRAALPRELPLLLAEPRTPSFRELQQRIGLLLHGEAWQTTKIPEPLARTGAQLEDKVLDEDPFIRPWMVDIASDHYEIDISRARSLLGWQPRHDLLETLPAIVGALKADPPAWYRSNHLNPAVVADRAPDVQQPWQPPPKHERHEHMQQMQKMHAGMRWVHFVNMMLGGWLVGSAFAFGAFDAPVFSDAVQRVTAERGLADPAARMAWLGWSDILSGLLVIAFATLSLSRRFGWAQWANAAIGLWLMMAPLLFWSPSAAVYTNDTLVGALIIAFAILVPMMPGMSHASMMDPSDVPVGWSYSPSTYLQRVPIVALGFIGFVIARQLTAYQLGHADGVWEPFFAGQGGRDGTETIITSDVSKAWPIADAGLGAVSYMIEVLMGVMGGRSRWRTMPWMVAAFGVVVVPLGGVSIFFIVIQPIMIGTWCTLCLAAALAMLVMIPYTLDELVAMGQFLVQSHRRGEPFWRTFFRGGASPGSGQDDRPGFDDPLPQAVASALRGVTLPWTLLVVSALGVLLMFTRPLFGAEPPMADSDHLVGALILTLAVSALAEVGRLLRLLNVPLGLWLLVAPWWLDGASALGSVASVVIGLAVIALSLPRGPRSDEHYGSWDRYVR